MVGFHPFGSQEIRLHGRKFFVQFLSLFQRLVLVVGLFRLFVHLFDDAVGFFLRLHIDLFRFFSGFFQDLFFLLFCFFLLAFHFFFQRFRFSPVFFRSFLFDLHGFFADFQISDHIFKLRFVLTDKFFRRIQNIILQPQSFGNGKGITLTGNTDQQFISRTQGFHAEFTAGIFYMVCRKSKYLQFAVVGSHCRSDFSFQQCFDDSNGQRRPFRRVSTGTQFVEQHQRIVCHLIHDPHDICHVGRERRKALFNALFVPDISKNIVEYCQFGIVKGRDMQTRLPHQGKQTQCFQGNCFTTRIGACDQQCGKLFPQINICRHHCLRIQQRMSAFMDIDIPLCIKYRLCTIHGHGQSRFRKDKIQLCQKFQIAFDGNGICRHQIRQHQQDLFNFFFFLCLQLLDLIVQLNNAQRFHEQRGTRIGLIVDHAGEGTSVFRLNGHAVSVISNGNDKVLQHISVGRGIDDTVQMVFHAVIGNFNLLTHTAEPCAGIVGNFRFGKDTAADFIFQFIQRNDQIEIFIQTRVYLILIFFSGIVLHLAANVCKFPDGHQFRHRKDPRHGSTLQLRSDFTEAPKGRRAFFQGHHCGFCGFLLPDGNVADGRRRTQFCCPLLRHRRNRIAHQFLYDLVIF